MYIYIHGIIISLWLICYIPCGLSISYLSIPGTVTHDRCNISHIFTFSFQFQCPMSCCVFHLCNCFPGGFRRGKRGRKGWVVVWGHDYLFKDFGLSNFSQYLWTSFLLVQNGIYY